MTLNILANTDSDNGLSPVMRQAIIWTNAGLLSVGHPITNFSVIAIKIQTFSLWECIGKSHLQNVHFADDISLCISTSMSYKEDIRPTDPSYIWGHTQTDRHSSRVD